MTQEIKKAALSQGIISSTASTVEGILAQGKRTENTLQAFGADLLREEDTPPSLKSAALSQGIISSTASTVEGILAQGKRTENTLQAFGADLLREDTSFPGNSGLEAQTPAKTRDGYSR